MQSQQSWNERREVYRVRPGDRPELAVTIETEDGMDTDAHVADISANGAAIRAALAFPAPTPGQSLTLSARSTATGDTLQMRAEVRSVREHAGQLLISVHFINAAKPAENAYSRIGELFNRRARRRARNRPSSPGLSIQVRQPGDDKTDFPFQVENLARGGLCARTDLIVDQQLAKCREVEIRLAVGESREPLCVLARVRYRAVDDEGVLYGLEFEPGNDRQALLRLATESLNQSSKDLQ